MVFTPLSSWVDVKKVAVGYVGFPVLAVGYVGFPVLAVGCVGFPVLAVGYVGFRASTQPTVLLPTLHFYMN
ncbi:MAG: hypothetical protein IM486_01205 [Microcystis sp. M114S2]|jgi:fatty acid desaturase|uniref:hypothetical protein n=1 Tax=unclassified Microcystis TaxID=2643300 RepID=UPI00258EA688|nr:MULTISPECIES: hypothetical protein [unclassified Microcystis]MDJ0530759.1 hypothetical protein [Microcystis sp. M53600_WE12]NCR77253.1 hypothetical protein [Microcystis aeruginosa K13-06]MCA2666060.1 hypothetical protein [Microcystis sp. M045S2]MCA2716140.1 hypothetical protein [Microcystis sp. M172S2]MCA2802765.1 hypothetical protein [Microcystis sp. M114S2]